MPPYTPNYIIPTYPTNVQWAPTLIYAGQVMMLPQGTVIQVPAPPLSSVTGVTTVVEGFASDGYSSGSSSTPRNKRKRVPDDEDDENGDDENDDDKSGNDENGDDEDEDEDECEGEGEDNDDEDDEVRIFIRIRCRHCPDLPSVAPSQEKTHFSTPKSLYFRLPLSVHRLQKGKSFLQGSERSEPPLGHPLQTSFRLPLLCCPVRSSRVGQKTHQRNRGMQEGSRMRGEEGRTIRNSSALLV